MLLNYQQALSRFGSAYSLKKALESKKIYRVEAGVYSNQEFADFFLLIPFLHPEVIYRGLTAESLLGITDEVPDFIDVATPANATRIHHKDVVQHYEDPNLYGRGVILLPYGNKDATIPIYGQERCLLDLVAHRAKVNYSHYLEMMRYYRAHQNELNQDLILELLPHYRYQNRIQEILEREIFE
jgi:hypothetical protein